MNRRDPSVRPLPMRGLGCALWLAGILTFDAGCSKPGDDGYTALLRYGNTDFRIAGIDARLADPGAPPLFIPGQQIALQAVVLATRDEPIEIEWIDCPSFFPSAQPTDLEIMPIANVDCLGTPQERRLGRGETTVYTVRAPQSDRPQPPRFDASGLEFNWPWDAALSDSSAQDGVSSQIEYDDGTIFLRATQGDLIRYARKSFIGLFDPEALTPSIDELLIDGTVRANDDPERLVRKPKSQIAVRFTARGVLENRMVQWFVSGGSLDRNGLTYYVEAGDSTAANPWAVAENSWRLPEASGHHQLIAIIGGSYGPLPYVRINVEVKP